MADDYVGDVQEVGNVYILFNNNIGKWWIFYNIK